VPQHDAGEHSPRLQRLGRAAIALVWFHQGLWCKLLSGCASHRAIVGSLPAPLGGLAMPLLMAVGAIEVAFGAWVLSGRRPRLAAAAQTALLVVMNTGGLVWGRAFIADPVGVVTQNLVFLALVWMVADEKR
jgi:uncharacterized membrane protein YphA (DoxX/SURF4 family)